MFNSAQLGIHETEIDVLPKMRLNFCIFFLLKPLELKIILSTLLFVNQCYSKASPTKSKLLVLFPFFLIDLKINLKIR